MSAHFWRSFTATIALVSLTAPSTMATASQQLAVGPRNAPPARTLTRRPNGRALRPQATPCAASGTNSFVGGGAYNVAGGEYSGIISGFDNFACNAYDAVGAGLFNYILDDGYNYASFIGAGNGNQITGLYTTASFIGAGNNNTVSVSDSGVGAGLTNLVGIAGADSFIGGGANNAINGPGSAGASDDGFVGAGQNNLAGYEAFVGAGDHNSATTSSGVVAGSSNKTLGPNSFVGAGQSNQAALDFLGSTTSGAFIGAGSSSLAYGNDSFVGAGSQNRALNDYSFIGAGNLNVAAAEYGVMQGGESNNLSGLAGAIGGGSGNNVAGEYGTVPGGVGDSATGKGSFAAGSASSASQNGSFVWSDGASAAGVKSSTPFQFLARASGGFFLYSNAAATAGVKLAAGSGTWASLSDRTMKSGIVPLDSASMLAKVAALPVSEWSYTSERGVRHVGPMAQDFYAAFRVGEDDRHITAIDEDGVALAATKGLNAKTQRDCDQVERENASLRDTLADLKTRVAALDRLTSKGTRYLSNPHPQRDRVESQR
jgi:hypothetical protein